MIWQIATHGVQNTAFTAPQVPFPLKQAKYNELKRLENNGVISKTAKGN